jgi:hypothetical protein
MRVPEGSEACRIVTTIVDDFIEMGLNVYNPLEAQAVCDAVEFIGSRRLKEHKADSVKGRPFMWKSKAEVRLSELIQPIQM